MRNKLWTNLLASLTLTSMTSCAALNQVPLATDSYCSAYQRVIQAKGEGTITAARSVKNRIAANEKTYVCNCLTPRPKFCEPAG